MKQDDRLNVHIGFSKEDAIKFKDELIRSSELTFNTSTFDPKHITLDEGSRMPMYDYVACRMYVRNIMALAGHGLRGEKAECISVEPPMVRMNTKDMFEHNCKKENGSIPEDAEYVLNQLLAIGDVHVMGSAVIPYNGRNIEARTGMFSNNDEFIRTVKNRVSSGHQVFLYNYKKSEVSGPYCSYACSMWRWNSIPK